MQQAMLLFPPSSSLDQRNPLVTLLVSLLNYSPTALTLPIKR